MFWEGLRHRDEDDEDDEDDDDDTDGSFNMGWSIKIPILFACLHVGLE